MRWERGGEGEELIVDISIRCNYCNGEGGERGRERETSIRKEHLHLVIRTSKTGSYNFPSIYQQTFQSTTKLMKVV